MRLWSLHPKYLDTRGLVALWREALLAQAVLRGETKGYRRHPQLERFRVNRAPLASIATYLRSIHREATRRKFKFDNTKIGSGKAKHCLTVTEGQLIYELNHLKAKLALRDKQALNRLKSVECPDAHPLFKKVPGLIETWERAYTGIYKNR